MNCTLCGEQLTIEEAENPYLDKDVDDGIICEECYHEHYEFTCCLCQEYGETEDQHNMLVVVEDGLDVPQGLYLITNFPYHMAAIIGSGNLIATYLQRLKDLPQGIDTNGYPCGHLCLDCQEKIAPEAKGKSYNEKLRNKKQKEVDRER